MNKSQDRVFPFYRNHLKYSAKKTISQKKKMKHLHKDIQNLYEKDNEEISFLYDNCNNFHNSESSCSYSDETVSDCSSCDSDDSQS